MTNKELLKRIKEEGLEEIVYEIVDEEIESIDNNKLKDLCMGFANAEEQHDLAEQEMYYLEGEIMKILEKE